MQARLTGTDLGHKNPVLYQMPQSDNKIQGRTKQLKGSKIGFIK